MNNNLSRHWEKCDTSSHTNYIRNITYFVSQTKWRLDNWYFGLLYSGSVTPAEPGTALGAFDGEFSMDLVVTIGTSMTERKCLKEYY